QVTDLFLAARAQNIGIAIDAEETERLGISLDLLEALCCDPRLQGWDGIGFVVQAYQKRAPAVLDWIIDLARRSGHRLMLRLVKGAYWDSEIKRTQVEGLSDYPLFTRKTHTDLSYLACARKLLGAPDAIFPQFATHNAHTLAAIAAIAAMTGPVAAPDRLEFQCLYGMGEPLYRAAFRLGLARSCRIYAPVGGHETLLAYLVRRLLENGANGSFVHRLADRCVAMAELVQEPAATIAAEANPGAAHPAIPKPRALYGTARQNSAGLDLFDDHTLQSIDGYLRHKRVPFVARPPGDRLGPTLSLRNPARLEDIVGHVVQAETGDVEAALSRAEAAAPGWAATTPASRAEILQRAATLMEERLPRLLPLIIREAGKSVPNAVGEVREAVDFLRYYAAETFKPENAGQPLGPFACISPWNFPLAIFTGQVAAALAAGNPVLAKPAEETPLTAMAAVTLLYEAGIPRDVLKTLPGAGDIGAALTADARIRGVAFTGSSSVAKRIQTVLARRLNPGGLPVPFIAETGGLNAMVVDSSALPEQVVADVLSSAFDSAGQRCSALRLLCVQTEIASRLLPMLEGAMAELSLGDPARLSTDIGPVISAEARDMIEAHVNAMRTAGFTVTRPPQRTPPDGFFVPPTLIRLRAVDDLQQEVFGPVLHVLTFDCAELPALIDRINARGFALTAGLHSRIDSVRNFATKRFAAGNIYINRNIIGATVGVQPFGGHGLSGTGPKAGGPLYLRRFQTGLPPLLSEGWRPLPGPAGEENLYGWRPRPAILCAAEDEAALRVQIQATLESGACAVLDTSGTPSGLEGETRVFARGAVAAPTVQAALFSGAATRLTELQQRLARAADTIIPVFIANPDGSYPHEAFITECAVSTNTAASGGAVELLSTRQEA
ncbi:MAG TPA: bifunctional proline dehydrogenase/L-glutamate gamma-semialdehyde dehydrogenase PutA, partial [Acidisoma sp.]|nr:bifunctional proline dehydrogenase/L-glutamate gamma-semialdehyde dehydrogenase PutA [Acidisoma sp.]